MAGDGESCTSAYDPSLPELREMDRDSGPRIVRVPGVSGGNVFLVEGERLTLIDSGLPGNADAILSAVARLGRQPPEISQILLTHRHRDHSGSAADLREATGARIVAHTSETEPAEGGLVLVQPYPAPSTPVDLAVEDGDELEGGFVVLQAPGHTLGSACFYLPERKALFLGDAAINNVSRLSRPMPWSNDDNAAYEVSLRRLAAVDAEEAHFGHGPSLLERAQAALRDLASKPPGPTWFRVLRGWRDLMRFSRQMRSRD
jgi:glyoxylase-like metal-dependent hydrolase (beta-lactamase superfamily II)